MAIRARHLFIAAALACSQRCHKKPCRNKELSTFRGGAILRKLINEIVGPGET